MTSSFVANVEILKNNNRYTGAGQTPHIPSGTPSVQRGRGERKNGDEGYFEQDVES